MTTDDDNNDDDDTDGDGVLAWEATGGGWHG